MYVSMYYQYSSSILTRQCWLFQSEMTLTLFDIKIGGIIPRWKIRIKFVVFLETSFWMCTHHEPVRCITCTYEINSLVLENKYNTNHGRSTCRRARQDYPKLHSSRLYNAWVSRLSQALSVIKILIWLMCFEYFPTGRPVGEREEECVRGSRR